MVFICGTFEGSFIHGCFQFTSVEKTSSGRETPKHFKIFKGSTCREMSAKHFDGKNPSGQGVETLSWQRN